MLRESVVRIVEETDLVFDMSGVDLKHRDIAHTVTEAADVTVATVQHLDTTIEAIPFPI